MSVEERTAKRIVVLISGSGSNLQALIDGCASGEINGQIVGVLSNRPEVLGLERAAKSNIPTQALNHKLFDSREAFDRKLVEAVDSWQPDLLVLAGFMRILTAEFVNHYSGRLLNIHPSLLPHYKGTNTHQRVLDAGDHQHGVSVHFVTPELDGGPVIMQARVDVLADDDVAGLAQRVLEQEHLLYPKVLEWFCDGRLRLEHNAVSLDGQLLDQPLILGEASPV